MTAPFRARPPTIRNNDFAVNEDPRLLDTTYIHVLGNEGDKMLTEEVKWLAVTHKSFDHGRMGYNDRLSFLGKRIVELQASLALITTGLRFRPTQSEPQPDPYGRIPAPHPALEGIEALTDKSQQGVLNVRRMGKLGIQYGLNSVVRWKPKNVDNLNASGQHLVIGQALYAIVGAVALQRGGEVANRVVNERILDRLGLRQ